MALWRVAFAAPGSQVRSWVPEKARVTPPEGGETRGFPLVVKGNTCDICDWQNKSCRFNCWLMLSPLEFDMVAFESTKEVSVTKKKEVSVKYFLDHDRVRISRQPWFFDIWGCRIRLLKKNPNPKLRHFIKWDQMRACILLFIPFVWASSLRFLCPSNVSLGKTLYLVVIYSPFPPLTLSPWTEENGGPLFSLMPDVWEGAVLASIWRVSLCGGGLGSQYVPSPWSGLSGGGDE